MALGFKRTQDSRKSRLRSADTRTLLMGLVALGTVVAGVAAELGRIWKKESEIVDESSGGIIESSRAVVSETVAVAREGYRGITTSESTSFNLMSSFVLSFGIVRATTYAVRHGIPPFRDVNIAGRHIHHFIPGLVLAFVSGSAAIITKGEDYEPYLAIPFGIGMGLVFDESALLLELQDVYWTREGLLSVQLTLGAATLLAATAYAIKIIRKGEQEVLHVITSQPAHGQDLHQPD